MTIRELRDLSGMTQHEFADYLEIPFRSIQNWEGGQRNAPEYVVELIEYKLIKEGLVMLSHLEIYGLNMKVVPPAIASQVQKSGFVKSMEYVRTIKNGGFYLEEFDVLVKEMVYVNTVKPEKHLTIFTGKNIKTTQDYYPCR